MARAGEVRHHALPQCVALLRRTITCWPPLPPVCAGPSFDLRRDAAYNLSLIYKASGADALAKQLLRQHLMV